MSTVEERHQRERDELEAEIQKMLAGAKGKNERKRLNQQAEKMRRELFDKQEEERDDPLFAIAEEIAARKRSEVKEEPKEDPEEKARLAAELKKQQNREKRQKKQQRRMQEESELANVMKDMKSKGQIESEELTAQLEKIGKNMHPVLGDGHCLYRAVGFIMSHRGYPEAADFRFVRKMCADEMKANKAAYMDFTGAANDDEYMAYCARVENSAEWGDEIELSALSNAFKMSFIVHRLGQEPMKHGNFDSTSELAFLEFYSTSGGHYNAVIPK